MAKLKVKSINAYFEEFILEKECESLSEHTIRFYKECFERFLRETSGFNPSQDSVFAWIRIMKAKELSGYSINHYLRGIRAFLYWCMDKSLVDRFKVPLQRCQENQLKVLSDEELKKLLIKPDKNASFTKYRTYVVICFILGTGARARSIQNLKISDIDLKNKEAYFRFLKNKTTAIIPLSDVLTSVIKNYIQTWDLESEYLFPDYHGNQLTTNALSHSLRKYCIAKGVKPYGPHAFRHSFARNWIKNGGSCFILQKILTHSDLAMTKRYVRLFGDDLKNNYSLYSPLDTLGNNLKSKLIKKKE